MLPTAVLTLLLLAAPPRPASPASYVFFGFERDRIHDAAFLGEPAIAGAQLKYSWRELEPERGRYELGALLADLDLLARHGKGLVVQLQDIAFSERRMLPDYLLEDPAFHGGVATQRADAPDAPGVTPYPARIARRWDPAVRARFVALLDALGRATDGRLEALTLAETAVDFGEDDVAAPKDFSPAGYAAAIAEILRAARAAFPRSRVIVYANFMPGEWLPRWDKGYLRGVYALADALGVGVGGPDLLPFRKSQRAHSLPLIAARAAGTPAGVAVQDGNLMDTDPATGRPVTARRLYEIARDELHLDYLFWGTEEPFYSRDVL
ncbi:MAG: hypothetical protein KC635_08165, partial [Myxococcales bacterium]|nr:hypothetical protein [Myxococcales bacterium]